jgi:hypothetical protein
VRLKAEHLRKHVDVLFDEIALSYPGSEPVEANHGETVPPVPYGVSVESQNSLPMPPLVYESVLYRRTQRNVRPSVSCVLFLCVLILLTLLLSRVLSGIPCSLPVRQEELQLR